MIADNWIQNRDEPPLFIDSQLEIYRGYFGPTEQAVLVQASRPGIAIGELARSMERQYRAATVVGSTVTPQPLYFGPYRDRIILVTEDVGGKSLAQSLGTSPWPLQSVVDIGIKLLKAILVFHRAGWLHRAVRPSHIIQDATGRILLVGLDNARDMEDTGPDYAHLPWSSTDRAYLAPEQTGRLAIQASWRTDIYAAGAVLYTLLAGRPAFDSQDPIAILYDAIAGVPPAPGTFRHEPEPFMDAVVAKAMAKNPDDRYQTLTGFISDLGTAIMPAAERSEPGRRDAPEACFLNIRSKPQNKPDLNPGELFAVMNELFPGDPDKVGTLSGLALATTGGQDQNLDNFFANLISEGGIWFEAPRCRWRVSEPVLDGKGLQVEIEEALPGILASLGESNLRFLECAACEGREFDPDAVAAILRSQDTLDALTNPALAAGILVPCTLNGRRFRFSHDSIPRMLYNGLESLRKSAWHNAYARRYQEAGRPELAIPHIMADPLKPHARETAVRSAQMLTQAGAAKVSDNPSESLELLKKAKQTIGQAAWQDEPGLALDIDLLSMTSASRIGDLDTFESCRSEVLRMAPAAELLRIDEVVIRGLAALGRSREALSCAIEALRRTNLRLPERPGNLGALVAFISSMVVLNRSGASLAELPDMKEPEARIAVDIISTVGPSAYIAKPVIIPFLVASGLRLCRRYGFHPQSAVLCAAMGMIAISRLGWYGLGFKYGQLAERIFIRPSNIETYAKSRFVLASFISHWRKSIDDCLEDYLDAARAGRSTGDYDYGSHAYSLYFQQAVMGGKELSTATTHLPEVKDAIASMNQELPGLVFRATLALLDSLKKTEDSSGKAIFDGRSFSDWQTEFAGQGKYLLACDMALYRGITGYLYFNTAEARLAINEQKAYSSSITGTFSGMYLQLLDCLIASREALASTGAYTKEATRSQTLLSFLLLNRRIARARLHTMRRLLKPLARLNPVMYGPKLALVTALLWFHRGVTMKAIDVFEKAVSLARSSGSQLDEAMVSLEYAMCLAADARQALAHFYQRAAYTALVRWGATGAAEALAFRYPNIKAWVSASPDSSESSGLLTLDAEALLKASAVIAAERDGTALLKSLLDVTMTTSGARFGAVWMPQDNGWIKVVSSSYETGVKGGYSTGDTATVKPSEQLRSCFEVQRTLVGTCSSGTGSEAFIPLLSRGIARGVLELGNEFVVGAFQPERMKIVEAIAAQASISIENAELYSNLERKVVERTRDLEVALKSVRQLQGLIPICSSCKKVRDDTGYWGQVEEYISARTNADFTHGLCPECLEHYYDELDVQKDDRKKESH